MQILSTTLDSGTKSSGKWRQAPTTSDGDCVSPSHPRAGRFSRRECAKPLFQRKPGWRTSGGGKPVAHALPGWADLSLANLLTNARASSDHVSHREQGPPNALAHGLLFGIATVFPATERVLFRLPWTHRRLGSPSARTDVTRVVVDCQLNTSEKGKPICNNLQPPTIMLGDKSKSLTKTFKDTRSPASRHTLTAALSTEKPRLPSTPALVVAKDVEWTATPAEARGKGSQRRRTRERRKATRVVSSTRASS